MPLGLHRFRRDTNLLHSFFRFSFESQLERSHRGGNFSILLLCYEILQFPANSDSALFFNVSLHRET